MEEQRELTDLTLACSACNVASVLPPARTGSARVIGSGWKQYGGSSNAFRHLRSHAARRAYGPSVYSTLA